MTESEWIEWNGGECPVEPDTLVLCRFRHKEKNTGRSSETLHPRSASAFWWHHSSSNPSGDIVAYRLATSKQD